MTWCFIFVNKSSAFYVFFISFLTQVIAFIFSIFLSCVFSWENPLTEMECHIQGRNNMPKIEVSGKALECTLKNISCLMFSFITIFHMNADRNSGFSRYRKIFLKKGWCKSVGSSNQLFSYFNFSIVSIDFHAIFAKVLGRRINFGKIFSRRSTYE